MLCKCFQPAFFFFFFTNVYTFRISGLRSHSPDTWVKINTQLYLQILQTQTSLLSWVGDHCLVPISDTMTPASPPTVLALHSRPTVARPSMGSNILRGQGSRDEVTVAAGGWLRELGVGCLEGLSHTLGLLFSAHSQWAPSGEQSSFWWL